MHLNSYLYNFKMETGNIISLISGICKCVRGSGMGFIGKCF